MKQLLANPVMRRPAGVIALVVLLCGAVWLVWNGYDRATEPKQVASEPASLDDESETAVTSEQAEAPSAEDLRRETATAEPEGTSTSSVEIAPSAVSDEQSGAAATATAMAAGEALSVGETGLARDPSQPETAPETAAEEAGTKPSFDIVRVEPSGETVIAGLAEPAATVEVLDGADPLATAKANERGEWALVLDEPLPPGSHDLAIRTTSPDQSVVTLSDQRIAVSVPEEASEEPLVVLNTPDSPSRIIQVPPEQEIASVEEPKVSEEAAPAANSASPQSEERNSPSEAESAATPTNPDEAQSSTLPPETEAEPGTESGNATVASQKAAQEPGAKAESDIAERSRPPETAEPEQVAEADPSTSSDEIAPETRELEPSAQQPVHPPGAVSGEETAPPGDTLSESDIAAAPPGPVAPSKSDETAEPRPAITKGEEQGATDESAEAPTSMPETEAPAAEQPNLPEAEVAVAAVETETDGTLYIAGTATASEPVRVYVDDEFVGEATPSETGTWLIETERELPEGTYSVRADQVGGGGAVIARAEVPFERQVNVAVLRQTSDPAGAAGDEISGSVAAPATVIIKRGDNLWRISRSIYGRGIRYSTIYQANQDQIRDPDLIYPGQVFILPSGDTNWPE